MTSAISNISDKCMRHKYLGVLEQPT